MANLKQLIDELTRVLNEIEERKVLPVEDIQALREEAVYQSSQLGRERKLRIAFAGKMKTAKSAIIDSLYFDARGVLPSAETPLTARLTTIQYAPEERAEVTFLSLKDYQRLQEDAQIYGEMQSKQGEETEISAVDRIRYKAAREMWQAIKDSGLDPEEYCDATRQIDWTVLNDYTGVGGRYSSLVGYVNLYSSAEALKHEALKHIEIVDTPGLGDPVISRECAALEKLAEVDVVFFLSLASEFIDSDDIDYIRRLRKMGVQRIHYLCSRFDLVLQGKDFPGNDLSKSREFRILQGAAISRAKNQNVELRREDIHPVIPMMARLSRMCQRGELFGETETFFANRYEQLFGIGAAVQARTFYTLSNIGIVAHIIAQTAAEKDDIIFCANRDGIGRLVDEAVRNLCVAQGKLDLKLSTIDAVRKRGPIDVDAKRNEIENAMEMRTKDANQKFIVYIDTQKRLLREIIWRIFNDARKRLIREDPPHTPFNVSRVVEELQYEIRNYITMNLPSDLGIDETSLYSKLKEIACKLNFNGIDKEPIEKQLGQLEVIWRELYPHSASSCVGKVVRDKLNQIKLTTRLADCIKEVIDMARGIKRVGSFFRQQKQAHNAAIITLIISKLGTSVEEILNTLDQMTTAVRNELDTSVQLALKDCTVQVLCDMVMLLNSHSEDQLIKEKSDCEIKRNQVINYLSVFGDLRNKVEAFSPEPPPDASGG